MKFEETVTKMEMLEWYEGLVDFLQDHIPCLDELIQLYEEQDD